MTPRERATPARGTGSGISYGCGCGEHVAFLPAAGDITAATRAAVAAVRSCPRSPERREDT